jgi:hypothetical protein
MRIAEMNVGRSFILILALVCGFGGAAVWLDYRDPLSSLPLPQHELQIDRTVRGSRNHRQLEHVVLHSDALGDIGIIVSLPDPLPDRRLPILMMLGGLGDGESNIRNLPDAGDNALVGYDWPMPVRFHSGLEFVSRLPDLYGRLMVIPGQVASALGWLARQPWADAHRVSLMGFSLGALAVPAIEDVAEHDGQCVGWTILAYGGAPFGVMVAANPHIKPTWIRPILGAALDLALRPLQPTQHLTQLSSQFLLLEGQADSLIPEAARNRLREAVPSPKTIVTFNGNHMGVGRDKMVLLQEIIEASKTWLIEKGAIDPL